MDRAIEEFRATGKKATLKDIANITGLSLSAVSQALNPSSKTTIGLSEVSIKKARQVAKKMNYRTHWGAVSIRSNFMYNLAFLKVEGKGEKAIHSPFLPSFTKTAGLKNFAVTMLSIDEDTKNLPSLFKNNRLDGIVVDASISLPTSLEAELNSSNIPRITINKKLEQNAIYVDEVHSASDITNYLIERQHKRILFLKPPEKDDNHYSIADREKGYLKAMKEAGLTTEVVEVESSLDYNQRLDCSFLDFDNLPDAILAYDDNLANTIAKVFYRKNIRIPHQISLAGFNGNIGALSAWCPLSTMLMPHNEMGKIAFEMLFKLIEKDNKESQKAISLKSKLIIGESNK
ncbi:MAG: LacI family DNA-binding transcriptional regulator [Opitutales bacterium]